MIKKRKNTNKKNTKKTVHTGAGFSRCIEDLIRGRVDVSMTHFPIPFSILFFYGKKTQQQKQKNLKNINQKQTRVITHVPEGKQIVLHMWHPSYS